MDQLELSIQADNANGPMVRAAARDWLRASGVARDALEDVLLVLSELFSNAVNASRGDDDVLVHLAASADREIRVAVTNTGLAFDLDRVPAPTLDRRGGRGLAIARAIGSVDVRHRSGRTTVAVDIAVEAAGEIANKDNGSR